MGTMLLLGLQHFSDCNYVPYTYIRQLDPHIKLHLQGVCRVGQLARCKVRPAGQISYLFQRGSRSARNEEESVCREAMPLKGFGVGPLNISQRRGIEALASLSCKNDIVVAISRPVAALVGISNLHGSKPSNLEQHMPWTPYPRSCFRIFFMIRVTCNSQSNAFPNMPPLAHHPATAWRDH